MNLEFLLNKDFKKLGLENKNKMAAICDHLIPTRQKETPNQKNN